MRYFFLALLVITFGAFTTNAMDKGATGLKKNYVKTNISYSTMPSKMSKDYVRKPRDSMAVGGGVGYIIDDKFKADITVHYRGKYKHSHTFTLEGTPHNARHQVTSVAFMLNGYFFPKKEFWKNFPPHLKLLDPYVMIGIGMASNDAGKLDIIGASDSHHVDSRQVRSFAWQIGLGSLLEVNNYAALDAFYRYVDLGITRTHESVENSTGNCGAIPAITGKFRAHEFALGINFKF